MANPNPVPRFTSENQPARRGRQKGSRDKINKAFLEALAADFEQHGADTLRRVREEDPSAYVRVTASLLPKEVEVTRPFDGMNDETLAAAIQVLADAIRDKTPTLDEPADEIRVN